jgi:Secretion system C-terminal sorting domain
MKWYPADSGLTTTDVCSIVSHGPNLFAGTIGSVYLSTNDGKSWVPVNSGIGMPYVLSLTVHESQLFASTEGGVYLSTNDGKSWSDVTTNLPGRWIYSLAANDTSVFVSTFAGSQARVYYSTNTGASWYDVSSGLTSQEVRVLYLFGSNLFAGTTDGIWCRPLSQFLTGVVVNDDKPTNKFSLEQNYPNPFNPGTTILFSLPKTEYTTLKIFDILGREIATLISQRLQAGVRCVQWTPAYTPSGVYFYQLKAGQFLESKKLILLK